MRILTNEIGDDGSKHNNYKQENERQQPPATSAFDLLLEAVTGSTEPRIVAEVILYGGIRG